MDRKVEKYDICRYDIRKMSYMDRMVYTMQYSQVTEILGGEKVLGRKIRSRVDLIDLGSAGIKKAAVSHLARYLSLSWRDMARLLPITERTLQRYNMQRQLSFSVSEQALQIAEVVATGVEVFGNREKFLAWLGLPCAALGDEKPLALLGSRFGAEIVSDELGRIAHGIPA